MVLRIGRPTPLGLARGGALAVTGVSLCLGPVGCGSRPPEATAPGIITSESKPVITPEGQYSPSPEPPTTASIPKINSECTENQHPLCYAGANASDAMSRLLQIQTNFTEQDKTDLGLTGDKENFTSLNSKLINKALKEGLTPTQIQIYESYFGEYPRTPSTGDPQTTTLVGPGSWLQATGPRANYKTLIPSSPSGRMYNPHVPLMLPENPDQRLNAPDLESTNRNVA
jgi:hypothetical protein